MEELSQGIHKITIFYAERGAGVSNLKIRFNFPKTNQLDLTNQVSTASANQDVFGKALGYIGSFTYKILNQATSGRQIPVEDSVGYLRNEGAVKFNDFKNSGTYRGSKTGESELKEADPDAETDGPIIGERSDVIKLVNKDSGKKISISIRCRKKLLRENTGQRSTVRRTEAVWICQKRHIFKCQFIITRMLPALPGGR